MICPPAEPAVEAHQASGYINQCAWCGAIGIGGGYDAVSRPIVNKVGSRRVSHGICPSCFDAVLVGLSKQAHSH